MAPDELSDAELRAQMATVRNRLREQLQDPAPVTADERPTAAPPPTGPPVPAGPLTSLAPAQPGGETRPSVLPAVQPGAEKRVAIGADHGGYELKQCLVEHLVELGYEPYDVGTHDAASVDYPDYAIKVARAVARGEVYRGVMIDGAGIGSAMAANKIQGIRAATCHNESTVINSREHNNANVLVLGSGQVNRGLARRLLRIWLATAFAGGRHARRVGKIDDLDK